jgi:membrane fusion protein, copper/silver efflux system
VKTIAQTILIASLFATFITGCAKEQRSTTASTASQQPVATDYYTCPMHPSVRSDKPGACPICHMALVKVSTKQATGDSTSQPTSIHLSSADLVLANVSTTVAAVRSLTKTIDVAGKIDIAEPGTKRISTRFGGRIEKLYVAFVGQHVKAGEAVAEVYSPDAVAAQREYLVALNNPALGLHDSAVVSSARLKLQLLGFTDTQLDAITKRQGVETSVMIYSPITGTVLKKSVDLQQYVGAGESLFEVSDLRTVWLQLDVYESDLAGIRSGQTVDAYVDDGSPIPVHGTVSFISPTLDPTTRTARVRATLDNATGRLKPEMYAHAGIRVPLVKSLVIPAAAVISNGRHDIVWVETSSGHFEPRHVRLGERCGDFYQVLDGLREGETVASQGAYLIDSESQLRASTPETSGN